MATGGLAAGSSGSTGHFSRRRGLAPHDGIASDASLDDLEQDAPVGAGRRGPDDAAQRAGDPPLATDHLAHVVLGNVQLEDRRALTLDLLDADGVGIVHEAPR